jgi:hypothetical protein
MTVLVLLLTAGAMLATLVVLGWVPDTREAGWRWYPAAGDLDPEGQRCVPGRAAGEDHDAEPACCSCLPH